MWKVWTRLTGFVCRLYGLNDFNLRWITYSNWTYTSEIKGLYVFDFPVHSLSRLTGQ